MAAERVVIVTGGTQGLGRVMVEALLAAGHDVVAVGRSGPGDLGTHERLLIVRGDVSDPADCAAVVDETIARFGHVDALINNAGRNLPAVMPGARPRAFYDVDVEHWQAIARTNIDGPFYMAHAVAPHLVARGWGRIINHVTSYRTMVRAGEHPYGATKAALEAMTSIWAADLAGSGVTVNAILPGGASDTRMIAAGQVPDRSKLIPPSVFAAPIRWLVSDAADGVTARRFICALWKADAADADNVAHASAAVAWPESVAASFAAPWPPTQPF